MTTAKRWSYCAGERGRNRVRAYEERPGGVILVEFYERDPEGQAKRKRISLGHSDRTKAKERADDIASAFGRNGRPPGDDITLETLFENCQEQHGSMSNGITLEERGPPLFKRPTFREPCCGRAGRRLIERSLSLVS